MHHDDTKTNISSLLPILRRAWIDGYAWLTDGCFRSLRFELLSSSIFGMGVLEAWCYGWGGVPIYFSFLPLTRKWDYHGKGVSRIGFCLWNVSSVMHQDEGCVVAWKALSCPRWFLWCFRPTRVLVTGVLIGGGDRGRFSNAAAHSYKLSCSSSNFEAPGFVGGDTWVGKAKSLLDALAHFTAIHRPPYDSMGLYDPF